MKQSVPFIFVCCQVGAEPWLKKDLNKNHAELSFAFSRPGFVTFKVTDAGQFDVDQPIRSVFARAFGVSVGSTKGTDGQLAQVVDTLPDLPYRHLHVWRRDDHLPGDRHFEPFHLPESTELGQRLKTHRPQSPLAHVAVNRTARVGDYVADVVVVDPEVLFFGWHRASTVSSRWPGGVPPLRPPANMVSRAYLKMEDALRWSQLPVNEGDVCVELGSSPGGSCQALLEHGLHVIGIDPAVMHEDVLAHPNFTHVRARAADLKRKEFVNVRWLISDANLAPQNTLDAIEHIVTNRRVQIRGLLITLKLLNSEMADQIDNYLDRIRSWGYQLVRARQLAFNRREICVLAVPSKNHLRSRWRK